MIGLAAAAQAGNLLVAGSPGFDPATNTGFKSYDAYGVSNSGTAVGISEKYVSGSDKGERAVRWDASGTAATELGNLGTDPSGNTSAVAYAMNAAGTAVGSSAKYVSGGYSSYLAVRWDAAGTTATELGSLGTDSRGIASACAFAVNAAGTAVGNSAKYVSGGYVSSPAVRWDASGTTATELGDLGTSNSGDTHAIACAVNDAGTAVGWSDQCISGSYKASRAVRWDASGTAATELGNLGTDSSGITYAQACAVNATGTAVGYSEKYVSGSDMGHCAVRWDTSGTAATELCNLWTDNNGYAYAQAIALNAPGTAVGYSYKYVSGSNMGIRAVRWDALGTAATELANLGTDSSGVTNSYASAVNDAGTTLGFSEKYISGSDKGSRAVIWLPDASVIDLNDLGVVPVPAGGIWTLTSAMALSADGWVAGNGKFDPDGAGPLASYTRLWVAQVGLGGTWTNATGGTWGRGPNWSTGTPAMQVGNATFNLNSAYTVALDRDELTKTIAISAGTVTINCNSHTLSTESGLSIANGATLKAAGTIMSDILNAGTLQLSGAGTSGNIANSNILEVLDGSHACGNVIGMGSVLIDAGAALTATSVEQNTVTIGAGATLTIAAIPGGWSACTT
jgi:hypothetical protein